jgi:hypothetical protein
VAEAAGDYEELELWRSDAEELSLTWHLVEYDPSSVFELREGDHRYAALRRPPRAGWLWSWEWIAETATSRWAFRSGGWAFIRARDRITDMATDSIVGLFRSWFVSSGVLELADGECYRWKAPWGNNRYFADEDRNRQATFVTYRGDPDPFCRVDLMDSISRSPHCLLLCCFGLHLLEDPPGQRWGTRGGVGS